ncbi:hypothetical protein WEN_02320 [Mycoplasma wenyonii str. Massachusetts]|uniref:Uncharacterized protein n=1 Tax=Mycoplasma wenyonii (strain Massachusetts) TaxID=1197325 RepID=I6YBB0_MYCWM|nr:hypothetical protein [Mycoplasma wenyonii]AFN65251.1 hypothetical protein WEN_02320 [Mycoplasma wenyonii str. Massachusetts]
MVIQSLVAKVAIATLATGIVGSSIAVPVVLTSGTTGTQAETKQNEPNLNECFVIPTEDNQQQNKLLMCEVDGTERTGLDEQNYWYREGNDAGTKNTKVTKISKKGERLEITLEGDPSHSLVTLKVAGEGWTKIQDTDDLDGVCTLTKDPEIKWQCFASDGMEDIKLAKFLKQ